MGKGMLYEYPAIFHTIEEGCKLVFLILVVALGQILLPLAMAKASVFLSHIKGMEIRLPEPTAVSSIPNEEELVVKSNRA